MIHQVHSFSTKLFNLYTTKGYGKKLFFKFQFEGLYLFQGRKKKENTVELPITGIFDNSQQISSIQYENLGKFLLDNFFFWQIMDRSIQVQFQLFRTCSTCYQNFDHLFFLNLSNK